jgi:hypothetical protein
MPLFQKLIWYHVRKKFYITPYKKINCLDTLSHNLDLVYEIAVPGVALNGKVKENTIIH